MDDKKSKKNKKIEHFSNGPGVDCHCPVCIFTKSQAPGDSYDLNDCPKFRAENKNKKIK